VTDPTRTGQACVRVVTPVGGGGTDLDVDVNTAAEEFSRAVAFCVPPRAPCPDCRAGRPVRDRGRDRAARHAARHRQRNASRRRSGGQLGEFLCAAFGDRPDPLRCTPLRGSAIPQSATCTPVTLISNT
jgi:hypothetical protein